MKRILFSLIATSAIFYSANAQTTNYSFEASEGFSVSDIFGQKANINTFLDTEVSVSGVAEVSSQRASNGVNSVKITNSDEMVESGIYLTSLPAYAKTTFSCDVFVPELGGSDNYIALFTSDGSLLNVNFNYQGNVRVANFATQQYEAAGTYTANTWLKFRADIDFAAKQVKYYLNDTLIKTGGIVSTGTSIDELDFFIDNFGSDAYFDNVQFRDTTTLATSEVSKKDIFRVYPNPTVDVVNFDVAGKINLVELYDAAGKLVKAAKDGARSLDVSAMSKGNYIVKVQTENGSHTQKLIKK